MYLYLFLAVNTKKAFIVKLFFLAYIFLNSFSFPEPFFLDIFQGLRGPMCLMEKGWKEFLLSFSITLAISEQVV